MFGGDCGFAARGHLRELQERKTMLQTEAFKDVFTTESKHLTLVTLDVQ